MAVVGVETAAMESVAEVEGTGATAGRGESVPGETAVPAVAGESAFQVAKVAGQYRVDQDSVASEAVEGVEACREAPTGPRVAAAEPQMAVGVQPARLVASVDKEPKPPFSP